MRNQVLVIAIAAAMFAGCGAAPRASLSRTRRLSMPEADASMPTPELPPAMIMAERGGFIPEGVEYDAASGRILTGSLSEGSVMQIHNDGRVTAVISDPDLVSSVGIEVDAARNHLLVANSDFSVFQGAHAWPCEVGCLRPHHRGTDCHGRPCRSRRRPS